ncbi:MAG TPA: hypothetical protein VI503_04605, partial [Gaiellaceae bacterium]|nr:hypothetical protein [Gaiellaceae bacterium]
MVDEMQSLDPETAQFFERIRVTEAWTRFRVAVSPPEEILRAHARSGLSRRCVMRLVGLGSRAYGELLAGEGLADGLAAAYMAGQ